MRALYVIGAVLVLLLLATVCEASDRSLKDDDQFDDEVYYTATDDDDEVYYTADEDLSTADVKEVTEELDTLMCDQSHLPGTTKPPSDVAYASELEHPRTKKKKAKKKWAKRKKSTPQQGFEGWSDTRDAEVTSGTPSKAVDDQPRDTGRESYSLERKKHDSVVCDLRGTQTPTKSASPTSTIVGATNEENYLAPHLEHVESYAPEPEQPWTVYSTKKKKTEKKLTPAHAGQKGSSRFRAHDVLRGTQSTSRDEGPRDTAREPYSLEWKKHDSVVCDLRGTQTPTKSASPTSTIVGATNEEDYLAPHLEHVESYAPEPEQPWTVYSTKKKKTEKKLTPAQAGQKGSSRFRAHDVLRGTQSTSRDEGPRDTAREPYSSAFGFGERNRFDSDSYWKTVTSRMSRIQSRSPSGASHRAYIQKHKLCVLRDWQRRIERDANYNREHASDCAMELRPIRIYLAGMDVVYSRIFEQRDKSRQWASKLLNTKPRKTFVGDTGYDIHTMEPEEACRLVVVLTDEKFGVTADDSTPVYHVIATLPHEYREGEYLSPFISEVNVFKNGTGKIWTPYTSAILYRYTVGYIDKDRSSGNLYTYLPYKNADGEYLMQTWVLPSPDYEREASREHYFAKHGFYIADRDVPLSEHLTTELTGVKPAFKSMKNFIINPTAFVLSVYWGPSSCLRNIYASYWVEREACETDGKWSIHGLWPLPYSDKELSERQAWCTHHRETIKMDDTVTRSKIDGFWVEVRKQFDDLSFFKFEYCKHGDVVVKFDHNPIIFADNAISLFKALRLNSDSTGPAKSRIHPGDDLEVFDMNEISATVTKKHGKKVKFKCLRMDNGLTLLIDIQFCYTPELKPVDCAFADGYKQSSPYRECFEGRMPVLLPKRYQIAPYVLMPITHTLTLLWILSGYVQPKRATHAAENEWTVESLCPSNRFMRLHVKYLKQRSVLKSYILEEATGWNLNFDGRMFIDFKNIWPKDINLWGHNMKHCAMIFYVMKNSGITSALQYMNALMHLYTELNAAKWHLEPARLYTKGDVIRIFGDQATNFAFVCHRRGSGDYLLKVIVCYDLQWRIFPCPDLAATHEIAETRQLFGEPIPLHEKFKQRSLTETHICETNFRVVNF